MVDPHRILPLVPRAAAALSLLLGCTPFPKSIGDALDTATDDDSSDGGSPDPEGPEWSHVLSADVYVVGLALMPDDGVAVIEHRQEPHGQQIVRYDPDGGVLWQVDVGSSRLSEIAALPDGSLVVGGSARDGSERAAVWILSPDGAVEHSHVHPRLGTNLQNNGSVESLSVSDFGIAYTVGNRAPSEPEVPDAEVWWVDLELAPQWSWTGFEAYASVGVTPTGEVRTLEQLSYEDDTSLLRGFGADGTPAWEQVVTGGVYFADDGTMVQAEPVDEGMRLYTMDATPALDVVVPSPPFAVGFPITHRNGLAFAAATSTGEELAVHQLDGAGSLVRELVRPSLSFEKVVPLDVAIALDGSLYVGGFEVEFPTPDDSVGHGFILKLPPPA